MPSKAEIKKNSKPSKKAAVGKKNVLEGKLVKSKVAPKKSGKGNGKLTLAGTTKATKKVATKRTLKNSITISRISPTIEQITERAHQLWVEEGYPEGRAEIHWHQAEKELSEL